MKAAWTCRACTRRLQASQALRSSLGANAVQRSPPNRRFTSEASLARLPAVEADRHNTNPAISRFVQKPSHTPKTDPIPRPPDLIGEKSQEDPFEAAFGSRRHQASGRRGRRRRPRKDVDASTSTLWTLEPNQTLPTIPEDMSSLTMGYGRWKDVCAEIRRGAEPKWLSRDEVSWVAELKCEGLQELWTSISTRQRHQLWKQLVLTNLLKHPEKVPTILSATLMEPLPPRYAVNDVLQFILPTLQKTGLGDRARRNMVEQILQVIIHYTKTNTAETPPIRPSTLGRLARHFSRNQLSELYNVMKEHGIPLVSDTALQFASKLGGLTASDDHREEALEIIQSLVSQGENLMDPKIASVITSLLHQKFMGEKSRFAPLQVLQYLIENGFLPNAITVTALIETLCERDEFHEALHLAELFTNNGLKLDAKACDVLLKGAQHIGNNERLREALDFGKTVGAPQSLLAKHAIHALYLRIISEAREVKALQPEQSWFYQKEAQRPRSDKPQLAEESQEAFIAMLRFYTKRFEISPLQSLIPQTLPYLIWNDAGSERTQPWKYERTLLPLLRQSIPLPEKTPLNPCSQTLALVLRAYVKSLWRPYDLMSMYSFFKGRLNDSEGQGSAARGIVRCHGSFIHDSFILAMMQTHALVRPALEVFGDMLKYNTRDSATGIHPLPSVYTFSIILAGLSRHKENKLFDKFKQIMEENGVTPNLVTYNTLLKNYAVRQDVGLTVGALRDLETLGYRPNQHTFDAFAKLRNQKQALDMMSKIIDENERRSLGLMA